MEPRCMMCGAPLDKAAPFHSDPRHSEVCSDECFAEFMYEDATNGDDAEGHKEGGGS